MPAIALMLSGLTGIASASPALPASPDPSLLALRERLPEDEIIYLIMPDRFANADPANDRGGRSGDRSITGYDPTSKAFYHGGDIRGVTAHLNYIQSLGATAIWLTPVFVNKAVQGSGASESSGYHGYWGLDFTDVDPHLGTRADYKAFVDAAHARGMKVYFDLVVNHTADVIRYRECENRFCPYRSRADYPYAPDSAARSLNSGFQDGQSDTLTAANFARLTSPDYAYSPYVPAGEREAKKPAWLNDPIHYHNRGESTFRGESSMLGDFMGLDDVFTEQPSVVAGFIQIYGKWIDDFGIDGFRIDTARHVNPEFWQAFVPAMIARAKARGIPHFHIFGEVMEFSPGQLARFTRVDGLPAVNDFALQAALVDAIAKDGPTDRISDVFRGDALYAHGEATARTLVTLTGNHDVLRFARAIRTARPQASDEEVLRRLRLAYAVILTARGIPALYYGDEQGFAGDGPIDQDSREDMFPTLVASYHILRQPGFPAKRDGDHFDSASPLFRDLSEMTHLRIREVALRRGRQITRASEDKPGLLAFSRLTDTGDEILVAFNTSDAPISRNVVVEPTSHDWSTLHGRCAPASASPATYRVVVPALDFILCKSSRAAQPR
jgi:glycosidase